MMRSLSSIMGVYCSRICCSGEREKKAMSILNESHLLSHKKLAFLFASPLLLPFSPAVINDDRERVSE